MWRDHAGRRADMFSTGRYLDLARYCFDWLSSIAVGSIRSL